MKKLIFKLLISVLFIIPLQVKGQVFQSGEFQGDKAAKLMTHLLREHSYIFDQKQLDTLKESYRQFRELESQGVPDWHMSRDEVNTQLSRLAGKILEKFTSEWLISVSYKGNTPYLSRHKPVQLPGDIGVLLLKIHSGSKTTQFSTIDYDMAALQHDDFGGLKNLISNLLSPNKAPLGA